MFFYFFVHFTFLLFYIFYFPTNRKLGYERHLKCFLFTILHFIHFQANDKDFSSISMWLFESQEREKKMSFMFNWISEILVQLRKWFCSRKIKNKKELSITKRLFHPKATERQSWNRFFRFVFSGSLFLIFVHFAFLLTNREIYSIFVCFFILLAVDICLYIDRRDVKHAKPWIESVRRHNGNWE